jgi:NAD(P)-dependent dehydrogenase (short-subunit alcohol dehydrogenase family)
MTGQLAGKAAFITGAARGQGRAHAVRMAEEGADIIAVDLAGPLPDSVRYPSANPDDLKETVRLVEAKGGRIMATAADIRDLDALRSGARHIARSAVLAALVCGGIFVLLKVFEYDSLVTQGHGVGRIIFTFTTSSSPACTCSTFVSAWRC